VDFFMKKNYSQLFRASFQKQLTGKIDGKYY